MAVLIVRVYFKCTVLSFLLSDIMTVLLKFLWGRAIQTLLLPVCVLHCTEVSLHLALPTNLTSCQLRAVQAACPLVGGEGMMLSLPGILSLSHYGSGIGPDHCANQELIQHLGLDRPIPHSAVTTMSGRAVAVTPLLCKAPLARRWELYFSCFQVPNGVGGKVRTDLRGAQGEEVELSCMSGILEPT